MKPQELRIGNLIEQGEIEMISNTAVWINEKPLLIDEIEPIPLTEESLLKFGFVYDGWSYIKGKYKFHAQSKNNKGGFENTEFYVKECLISFNVDFVHQLQNLYFALTNEELKIT